MSNSSNLIPLTLPKPKISASQFLEWQTEQQKSRQAMDMFTNALARTGFGTPSLLESTAYPLTRLTYQYWLLQSLYRNHWLVRKVIDSVPEDMLKNWVDVVTELPPKALDKFNEVLRITNTQSCLLRAMEWGRLFGGAGAVIIVEGDENRLDEPLIPEDVPLNGYKGIIPFDRWSGITPVPDINHDINDPIGYGLPKAYRVTTEQADSFEVHASRVLRFIGRDVPYWEKQAEMRWGVSEVEIFFEELRKRDNTSWNLANLIFRANIFAIRQPDLASMLSGMGSSQAAQQRFASALEAMNHTMSNQGLLILPEKGSAENHSYSFGGLGEVYMHFKEDICAATGYPYSRLFGKPSGGLGTTNEGDEHVYYDSIGQKQKSELDPNLRQLLPIVAVSTWGKVPQDFSWIYKPVRSLTNEEQADLTDKKSTPIFAAFNAGIIGRKTTLQELQQLADETGAFSNITDDIIAEADDAVITPAESMGMELLNSAKPAPEEVIPEGKPNGKENSKKNKSAVDSLVDMLAQTTKGDGEIFEEVVERYRDQAKAAGPDALAASGLNAKSAGGFKESFTRDVEIQSNWKAEGEK